MLLTGSLSRRYASRFTQLGLMAVVLALPYAVPPLGDWLLGRNPAESLYLAKPVENQFAFVPLAVFGLAVPVLLWRSVAPPARFPRHSIIWLALLFTGTLILSAFVAPSFGASLRELLLPLAGVAGFLLLQSAEPDRRTVEKLMFVALLAALPASLYALAQSQGWEFLPYHRISASGELIAEDTAAKQQISSTFGHPNYLASYLTPLVFWSLYFALSRGTKLRRLTGTAGFFVLVAALVVAGTRGAWVAVAAAGIPFYFALAMAPAFRRQLLFSGALAGLLAALLLLVPNPILRAQFRFKERLLASKEITHRLYYWTAASRMWADHPLLGVGYGAYDPLFLDYAVALQTSGVGPELEFLLRDGGRAIRPIYTHNDHLQIAAEGGSVGAVAWIALWSAFFAQALETIRRGRKNSAVALFAATFLASAGAMAIEALAGFPFHIPVSGFFFWLLLACWAAWRGFGGGLRRQGV